MTCTAQPVPPDDGAPRRRARMRILVATMCALSSVAPAPHAPGAGVPKADWFVAPNGNDAWTGTLPAPNAAKSDGPLATLAAARDAVRVLKAKGPLATPATVMVRGGTYRLEKTLVFDPRDSGTKECPVAYVAFPGETPVLSGGRPIVADWKPYQGRIRVCDIPDVRSGKWYFRQLSVAGTCRKRSRTPDQGEYLRGDAVSDTSFVFREGHMRKWRNLDDVEVLVFHSWNASRFRIRALDEDRRVVEFRDPKARHPIGWKGAGGPNRYYIENTLEGVTEPGEWYLDRRAGKLYYWPREDDPADARFVAPMLEQLVRFEGNVDKKQYVEYVTLSGFTFTDTDWHLPDNGYPDCGDVGDIVEPSTITYQAARFCRFTNNRIRNTGAYALEITGDGNLISDNEIRDTGGGGIISRSYGEQRNVISYNHIHHCGLTFPSAVGINIDEGGGTIAHNLIHHITHSGVYGRHWATATQPKERRNQAQGLAIEFNEIHDVMLNINDGAGIFIRDSNITIHNNLIHDVYADGDRCPGWGIYLGCETRDAKVTNNVVYRTLQSVHVWFANRNVTIENNVFAASRASQINYQNPAHLKHENIAFRRNIVYCTEPGGRLFDVSGERSLPAESDRNIVYSTVGCVLNESSIRGLPGVQSFGHWKRRGLDANSIPADPQFVDPKNHDYSLNPASPAFKVGFTPIDLSRVGLRGRGSK